MEYMPYEIEYNRMRQLFNLFCIVMIVSSCGDVSRKDF